MGRAVGFRPQRRSFFMPQITNLLTRENLEELNRSLGTNFKRIKTKHVRMNQKNANLKELEKMMINNRGVNYDKNTY